MASDATTVVVPAVNAQGINNWTYLTDLIDAARAAAGQPALFQHTAILIRYVADKDNVGNIFFTTDPTSLAEGQILAAQEVLEDVGMIGAGVSTRKYYVKSANGTERLDVLMEN